MKEEKGVGGGEGKRVVAREVSVAEKRWVRRSKTAIWWMSLWMKGTSKIVARRMREKIGLPEVVSSSSLSGWRILEVGGSDGGGGGAAAAIFGKD